MYDMTKDFAEFWSEMLVYSICVFITQKIPNM